MSDEIERIITIPMRATKMAPRTKRAARAVQEVRENIVRHMKVDPEDVWIDKALNETIWERGIQNPPHKITVKAVKFDDGLVEVSLVGAETESRHESEAKPKKAKAEKKDEAKEESAESEADKKEKPETKE